MPFDGSGNFNRVMNWVADAAAAIKITATRHDSEDDNLAAGLSNTLTKDGQSQPTANIPMNGKKLTNLGTPTATTDAATKAYVDTADGLLAPKASPTFTGRVTLPPGAAGNAGLNMPVGVAPTAPTHGDLWNTAAAWIARLSGVNYTLAMLEAAQTWTLQQLFSARIGVNGAVPTAAAANYRSGLTVASDITVTASGAVGFNGYVDPTGPAWEAFATGWVGYGYMDPATGQWTFARSSASVVAGAAVASIPAWLTANPTTGVALVNAGTFTWNGADVLVDNVNNLGLAAGFGLANYVNEGSKSGAYTPGPTSGNMRAANVNGALVLTADANTATAYTLIVALTNIAGAGAITTSGWSKVSGDPFDATVGSVFLCNITKLGGYRSLNVEKLS